MKIRTAYITETDLGYHVSFETLEGEDGLFDIVHENDHLTYDVWTRENSRQTADFLNFSHGALSRMKIKMRNSKDFKETVIDYILTDSKIAEMDYVLAKDKIDFGWTRLAITYQKPLLRGPI